MGVPAAPSRTAQPSAWRNAPGAATAAPAPPPMSRQDRQAYENCPDPQRYARKHRPGRLVRIW
ncbi:hypothetical protein [Hymenobacter sp. CRA2]|uniref:hypothetical protein n=1 Tax=Hymenobacter sp. CRA2 TaxID=1955620 RepID=UPI00111623A3|nr:hypothetical protein [Hymenobacter sp. CRA2]